MKIVFFGTPEFAVASLKILVENKYDVVAVVTAPDQPAGRGLQLKQSAVKEFALQHQLKILQPEKLKNESFIAELKSLNADLFIVVAFRMLPEIVWNMPPLGTFNLHASLLPHYRGAAPINWAIINGERETGVTTFFLQQQIDTGNIIMQQKVSIDENETAGELHDELMTTGSQLLLKTVQQIEAGKISAIPQDKIIEDLTQLKHAPKIFKADCKIDWNKKVEQVHNHIRGLSPFPAAFTTFVNSKGEEFVMKIFKTGSLTSKGGINTGDDKIEAGKIFTDKKTFIKVGCTDGNISILELQQAGKKKMMVEEFLRGFRMDGEWIVK